MMKRLNQKDLQQSLKYLGCSSKQIQEFMNDFEKQHFQFLLHFLQKKRFEILDDVHQKQKQIDHLDYLIYTLKNQNKS